MFIYIVYFVYLSFYIVYSPGPRELNHIQFNRFDSVARNSMRGAAPNIFHKFLRIQYWREGPRAPCGMRARGVSRHDCAQPLSDPSNARLHELFVFSRPRSVFFEGPDMC